MEVKYESVFILKPDLKEEKTKEILDTINNIIKSENGKSYYMEALGEKILAYTIKGQTKGFYYVINFKCSDDIKNIDKKISIKINTIEEIIKHIIVKKDEE